MSSVPGEVIRDILQPLDRRTLDDVQFTNRRYLQIIMERMSDVCLRQVKAASFWTWNMNEDGISYAIHIDGPPTQTLMKLQADTAHPFSEFVQALRSSRVVLLTLNRLVFTPALAALVLQTPIATYGLVIPDGSCTELTPIQFQKVLLHFSPVSLYLGCHLRACQVTDGLLRAPSKNCVRGITFTENGPVDGGSFHVTDDAIVDFCVQENVPIGREGGAATEWIPGGNLVLRNGSFTKSLFRRLVEASRVSTRTRPLRIDVSPVPVEEEDLRDFTQHLSYRHRGQRRQLRIYDFPGEHHGAVVAMHLQIVLHSDNRLELVRARHPNRLFYESD